MSKALGLVETRGLVAAIEAADAMVKAANVTLIGKERTDPALITIKIVGETAAVRSAVDAGAAAAKRVGVLVSTHIIPQPDLQMISLIPEIEEKNIPPVKQKQIQEEKKPKTFVEEKPVEVRQKITEVKQKSVKVKPKQNPELEMEFEKPEKVNEEPGSESDTISRLRKEALGIKEKTEKPTPAGKGKSKIKMQELEILNVHQLRRLARDTEGFPIYGRQISMANRNELLDYFKKLV
ncbi:MAG TPA: BMC domain-containing protein [Ignavibacteriaceae bacterium]|nr:BMC domain-containing protein [Ignavibacteriaceae bacterium]